LPSYVDTYFLADPSTVQHFVFKQRAIIC